MLFPHFPKQLGCWGYQPWVYSVEKILRKLAAWAGEEMPLIACSGDTGGVLGKTSHLGRELKLRAIGALDVLDVGSVGKCRLEKI